MGPSGRTAKKRTIDLYGVTGKFDLSDKNIRVHFFSTAASARDKTSGKYALLEQLKPMRERVTSSEIKDLNSLLQRDLNDSRVAEELIPYVLGKMSEVVFFPAVLAVLIPRNFLTSTSDGEYPGRKRTNENEEVAEYEFGNCWNLTQYKLNGKESELALLEIYEANTDIIVLDGQHRANAFRIVSDTFEKGNNIHLAFYTKIDKQPDEFKADLPVTIIWFEFVDNASRLTPTLISRKLFVDVNNTAKSVSKSRTILLNDYEVNSLLTRFLYSGIAAKHGFEAHNFSLLHTAFDIDTDLQYGGTSNCFVLTTPEIIYELFSWFCFGPRNYSNEEYKKENYKVSRHTFRKILAQFNKIFPMFEGEIVFGDDEEKRVVIKDIKNLPDFEGEFKKILFEPVYKLFNELKLFESHYDACKHIETWVVGRNTTNQEVWKDVFCGGEGLYYTFKNKKEKSKKTNNEKSIENYLQGVDEIEREFKRKRAELFRKSASNIDEKEVTSIFESIGTKAFQVGLIMAFDCFIENDTPSSGSKIDEFVKKLNDIELNTWANVFIKLKNELISTADPRKWPVYQRIIIWLIQPEYYNDKAYIVSPEGQLYKKKVDGKLTDYISNGGFSESKFPSSDDFFIDDDVSTKIAEFSKDVYTEVKRIIKGCDQKPISVKNEELIEISRTIIKENKDMKNIWGE